MGCRMDKEGIMNWRSLKIWIPVFLICVIVLGFNSYMAPKQAPAERVYKSLPMHPGAPPLAAIPAKTDYMDLVLKFGGLSGAIMSCIGLVEKVAKLFGRKHEKETA